MESELKSHSSFNDFLKKRFAKVYLPVLLVSVIWIPLWYLFVADAHYKINPIDIIYYVFWDFRDPVLWFIKVLFILYLIFYFFTLLRLQNKRIIANVVLIAGTLLTAYFANLYGYPYISIPLFATGIYSSIFKKRKFKKIPICYIIILIGAIFYLFWFLITHDSNPAHGLLNCLVLLTILLAMQALSKSKLPFTLNSNQTLFLSSVTFAIYIVHFKVLDLMVSNWGHITFLTWLLVTIVITIITTYLIRLLRI